MVGSFPNRVEPLIRMADGTIKQVNPLSDTQVWTVTGRSHRPLTVSMRTPQAIDPSGAGHYCALCPGRYLDTPPEKARLIRNGNPGDPSANLADGPAGSPDRALDSPNVDYWHTLAGLSAHEIFQTVAEFRRIPNLFEILSYDYWHRNYGFELAPHAAQHMADYLSEPAGREHTLAIARTRMLAGGLTPELWEALDESAQLAPALAFFGGGHELIVPRRHYVDGATTDDQLASSGTLTPEEHYRYMAVTVDALRAIYQGNRYARYVAVFQNWLKPAGASFEHLHKQLAAIDDWGPTAQRELLRLRDNPNLYNELAVNYAGYQNLVIAENEHAVAFAGFGHRYPTLEVYSRCAVSQPWEHTRDELRGVSDLLHACHAATGAEVPCNEEWHHRPIDVELPMPWRIMLKWRVSTLAGFEGGTKIYLNTIDPWTLRDRVVPRLFQLRAQGRIADMRIATECLCQPNSLRYIDQRYIDQRYIDQR